MDNVFLTALIGGALIGLAATVMLLALGRITGVSGILFGALKPVKGDTLWRLTFVLGLVVGGGLYNFIQPGALQSHLATSTWEIVLAGLLVGFGTRLGSGCTSGHGICGISRLSPRSLIATITFMATGIITVFVVSTLKGL